MMAHGEGWVLSVPSHLLGRAAELCADMSFGQITEEGDRLGHEWWDAGPQKGTDQEAAAKMAYREMTQLAQDPSLRGWSHYYHWYCDEGSWDGQALDEHTCHITEDREDIWQQWSNTSWAIGGPGASKHNDVADAFGYVSDGRLASVSQVFANPGDFAWEIGSNTLPDFRCRGFATEACRASTAFILEQERMAWYYYNHYNRSSSRIPEKLPFFLYGETLVSHHR